VGEHRAPFHHFLAGKLFYSNFFCTVAVFSWKERIFPENKRFLHNGNNVKARGLSDGIVYAARTEKKDE
jgi:hypothetical protein